ncbi:hypothetical protein RUM44_004086 [Polyplax serrata]|uniref:PDZ domain-containing protein n=1 Tax=Polyplax serrata TaxID=468196 RepID=A0ABR1B1V2_POLSC
MPKLLDILLQRNNLAVPWGFSVSGGRDFATHPVISAVTYGALASQYLNAGDKILEIENIKADSLLQSEVNQIIQHDRPSLHLLIEKSPSGKWESPAVPKGNGVTFEPEMKNQSYETGTEQECIKENNGVKRSTKIWLRETNKNSSLGEYDLRVNFQRTKYTESDESETRCPGKSSDKDKNQERMRVMSESFDKAFRLKLGEWLEENMLEVGCGPR